MSSALLEKIKTHIVDDGGLLGSYSVKYYRWSDKDLNGAGNIALFKMTGTGGVSSHEAQQTDVSLFLLANSSNVKQADQDMLAVVQYLRSNYTTTGVYALHPLYAYTGPNYLENGRARFELVIRCGTEDH